MMFFDVVKIGFLTFVCGGIMIALIASDGGPDRLA